ncbi:deaminase domain-containing protein [Bacillus paramycoides]|uniref:deaminase domain-containing protein n=1 Tax=Bacillus paramycoides TaxID=2026194 RepID=UPI002E247AE1|nr:deaminase domain-containing protein [Bacillus paramycoides]MED1465121.1 deaminase domain-containing protein [Bacillus paramycoides]MED1493648.1 deaminase domain-containing protein [Bacillus paramycoides]
MNVEEIAKNSTEKERFYLRNPRGRLMKEQIDTIHSYIDALYFQDNISNTLRRKLIGGNFGVAMFEIDKLGGEVLFAHSKIDVSLNEEIPQHEPNSFQNYYNNFVPLLKTRDFKTLMINSKGKEETEENGAWDREIDTESKLLEYINKKITEANLPKTTRGTIHLFTELPPCKSCEGVIKEFIEKYSNCIEIELYVRRSF